MATNLCGTVGGNTGGIDCDGKRKVPRKLLVGAKEFTPSEYADEQTLIAAILAAINLDSGNPNKLFPFPEIFGVVDNTEAPTTGSLTLGPIRKLRNGKPGYTYQCEVGHTQFQKLKAFDGKIVPAVTLDDAGQGWFEKSLSNNNIKGEMIYLGVTGNGFEDGNSAETGVCTITVSYLSADNFDKRSVYFPFTNLSAGDLQGLKDVAMSEPQAHAANVYKIQLKIKTAKVNGDLNIFDQHGAAIAALAFTAGSGANFATPLPVTSTAVDNALKALTVTFDSTAHTALGANEKFRLNPPSVAIMAAAGITGIEITPIILTK